MTDERIALTTLTGVAAQPGDVLVITTADYLDRQDADRLRAELEARLPGIRAVFLDGVTSVTVCRPKRATGGVLSRDDVATRVNEYALVEPPTNGAGGQR